jgi:hypothetical protein
LRPEVVLRMLLSNPRPMLIRLRRLDNVRHELAIDRPDGTAASQTAETRSVLLHDLVHFAIEAEAGIEDGFWGALAGGVDFAALQHDEDTNATEAGQRRGIHLAESLVGPMQSVWKGQLTPERYVQMARGHAALIDDAFVARVLERIRRLWGHWQGTPFHGVMELRWPPGSDVG